MIKFFYFFCIIFFGLTSLILEATLSHLQIYFNSYQKDIFNTGLRFQEFYLVFSIIGIILDRKIQYIRTHVFCGLIFFGIIFFCFNLYLKAFDLHYLVSILTPFGAILLGLSWIVFPFLLFKSAD